MKLKGLQNQLISKYIISELHSKRKIALLKNNFCPLLVQYVSSDMAIKLTFANIPRYKIHAYNTQSPVSVKIQHAVLYLSYTKREVNSCCKKTTVTITSQVGVRGLCNQHPMLVIDFYLTDFFTHLCFKLIILSLKRKQATKNQYVTFTRIMSNGHQCLKPWANITH